MKNTVAKEILKIEKDKLMAEPESNRDWELITALEIAIEALDNAPTIEISGLPKIHYDRGFIAGYEKGKTESL